MASSSSKGEAPAAVDSSSNPEEKRTTTTTKKTKMVRFTPQQIACCIASGEPSLPIESKSPVSTEGYLAKLPQHLREAVVEIEAKREARKARMIALQESHRKERQDILDQYYAKGYAEYEVSIDEEEEEEKVPARGRQAGRKN